MIDAKCIAFGIQDARYLSSLGICLDTPVSVVHPCHLLALLAAVFRSPASSTFCKFTGVLLPLAALIVSALSNATPVVVLAAKITHDHSGPVLHIH